HPKLVSEPFPLLIDSPLHQWMSGRVGVFDHPYFALTDKDGRFEIKQAPVGKFRIYVQHERAGWLHQKTGEKLGDGQAVTIKRSERSLLRAIDLGRRGAIDLMIEQLMATPSMQPVAVGQGLIDVGLALADRVHAVHPADPVRSFVRTVGTDYAKQYHKSPSPH